MSTATIRHVLSAPWQRWFVLALLLFFAALSAKYTVKVLKTPEVPPVRVDPHNPPPSAILRWKYQFTDGDGPAWSVYNFPYPPIMALVLKPLFALPDTACALTWYYLKVGMTLLALAWVFRLVEQPGVPVPAWSKVLAVLLALRPIMGDLVHGNINLFILFLVVGALYAYHRRRDGLCGVVLALAIACKVTPALFVPYLLWKRAWSALAGCAAGLVLFFALIPACFLGWQKNADDLDHWYDNMIVPFVVRGQVTSEHNNQSLPGLTYRLLTHSASFCTYDEGGNYVPLEYHNLVTLDPATVRLLLKACMLFFAGLVVWTCRTPTTPRGGWRLAAEFGIIILGMLLFSERTWKHHGVTLVLPFGVIAYYLAACRPGWKLGGYLGGTLAATALLMLATSTGWFSAHNSETALRPENLDAWDRFGKMAQVYGAYVWAYLILLAALVVLLQQPTPTADPGRRAAGGLTG
jgi:alpha-1,2-mannosyltransferase